MKRGDVVLVRVPHASGQRGKKRLAVVVQSDAYSNTVPTLVVAEITKNLALAHDPACLFLDLTRTEVQGLGLGMDSVVTCLRLTTIYADTVDRVLGSLPPAFLQKLDDCLKAALGLP
jgi:mRNA interferase MazF